MPGQGRLGDKASVAFDAHGCPGCPHPAIGPAIQGSPDVNVNRRPALRVGDRGIHAACCGANTWAATKGSQTVFINGKSAHRIGDQTTHCGGQGQLIEGSVNVIVGEFASDNGASARARSSSGIAGTADRSTTTGDNSAPSSSPSGGGSNKDAGGIDPRRRGQLTGEEIASDSATEPPPTAFGHDARAPGVVPATPDQTWIEIELVGENGLPIVHERYLVVLPSHEQRTGYLDDRGRAHLEDVTPGTCVVSFPDLDADAWDVE